MSKLVVMMDPVNPAEIFEIQSAKLVKISQVPGAADTINFIKNYVKNTQENVEVSFMGPDSYVEHWIDKANQIEFVKANKNEIGD